MSDALPCDLTALISTYNRAATLRRTLEFLAAQAVPPPYTWEVLVVENNCTDDTLAVVREFQATRRIPQLRCMHEARQGAGHARRSGIRAAHGRLIAIVDDDCWLDADWVAEAIRFADGHPRAGAFGGRNELLWQQPPPNFVVDYGESLARQDFGDAELCLPPEGRRLPCGAGLVVRRAALFADGLLESLHLRGRDPGYHHAGEDSEIVLRLRRAGWDIWYTPRLRLRHVIPPQRMTLEHMCRLHRGFGRAEVLLRRLDQGGDPSWLARWASLGWAAGEMVEVWRRFWLGYVKYENERPSWLIRLSFARGCLEGALRFLIVGRPGL
jgi:glycosyltransferase involved in cell wall biosynthesis